MTSFYNYFQLSDSFLKITRQSLYYSPAQISCNLLSCRLGHHNIGTGSLAHISYNIAYRILLH